jgi:predicted DNA binding CopG/RHH family protein
MRRIKLTRYEQSIEDAIERGEYRPVSKEEDERIRKMLAAYRKNSVLHMRINNNDLSLIKSKAKKLGVKYQTFIAEYLHKFAHA